MKFENQPEVKAYRKTGHYARTVGELMEHLAVLPEDLPLYAENQGEAEVVVTQVVSDEGKHLALDIRPFYN